MKKKFYPKVSIIVPIYDGSNYMQEAINSALAQIYKNTEIIVVNDGSTDNTDEVARSYGDKIRYFKKENGGVSSALNLALREMKGEYFSWLSHDDLYKPEKIEKQIKYLSTLENKNVILYSDYERIDERSKIIGVAKLDHKMLQLKREYSLLRGCVNGITLLIPKKAFDEYGFFNEKLKCIQDYELWNKMMNTYEFMHMPIVLAKYRIHGFQDSQKSPNVAIEGDSLWINMIDSLSTERKKILEGSELNFYKEMVFFLRQTPYREAEAFANKKANEILIAEGKNEIDFINKFIFPAREEILNKARFFFYSPHKFFKKYFR